MKPLEPGTLFTVAHLGPSPRGSIISQRNRGWQQLQDVEPHGAITPWDAHQTSLKQKTGAAPSLPWN